MGGVIGTWKELCSIALSLLEQFEHGQAQRNDLIWAATWCLPRLQYNLTPPLPITQRTILVLLTRIDMRLDDR